MCFFMCTYILVKLRYITAQEVQILGFHIHSLDAPLFKGGELIFKYLPWKGDLKNF